MLVARYQHSRADCDKLQTEFVMYKAAREQLEDPFVLRLALDVSRKQLWGLQARMEALGPDGGVSRQELKQLMEEKQDLSVEVVRLQGEVGRLEAMLEQVG